MRLRSALAAVARIPFAAASFALLLAVGACTGQGEGERCDVRAASTGDSDCQSGLVCRNIPASMVDVCCPADLSQATTAICSNNSVDVGGDAGHEAPDATFTPGDDGGEAGPGDDGATE
jgi:hypothetical protein